MFEAYPLDNVSTPRCSPRKLQEPDSESDKGDVVIKAKTHITKTIAKKPKVQTTSQKESKPKVRLDKVKRSIIRKFGNRLRDYRKQTLGTNYYYRDDDYNLA